MVAIKTFTVVEDAPSHDGCPCASAWEGEELDKAYEHDNLMEGVSNYEASGRPQYGIQIYDTTQKAADKEHLRRLAKTLHEMTNYPRGLDGGDDYRDRLDVYPLPMSDDTTADNRVRRCIEHNKKEIHTRMMNQRADFFIPPLYLPVGYQRAVIVIHRPEHHWIAVEADDILSGEKGPFILGG